MSLCISVLFCTAEHPFVTYTCSADWGNSVTRVRNDAWRELVKTRDLLAIRIMDMVLLGESDPAKLKTAAMAPAA